MRTHIVVCDSCGWFASTDDDKTLWFSLLRNGFGAERTTHYCCRTCLRDGLDAMVGRDERVGRWRFGMDQELPKRG